MDDSCLPSSTIASHSIWSPYCPKCGDLVKWNDRASHMAAHYPAPYSIEFTEPTLPPTTNGMASFHWWKKKKLSDTWNRTVMAHVLAKGGPKSPLTKAKLTLIRYSSREPDYDGLVSSFKVVVDALRYCGVIKDDRMSNIGIPIYDWQLTTPKNGFIEEKVEEVI